MSIIQKIKQYFKKQGQREESTTSGSQTIRNIEGKNYSEQLAAETRRSEAEIKRDNEYLASVRREKIQEDRARLERVKADELHKEQRRLEQQRVEQERLKEKQVKERRALEIERLKHIYSLYQNGPYVEYLREAELFRKEYGKNIRCDICGEWEMELFNHRGQTYCERHIPTSRNTENEHKIIAGRHGSSRSYIKK